MRALAVLLALALVSAGCLSGAGTEEPAPTPTGAGGGDDTPQCYLPEGCGPDAQVPVPTDGGVTEASVEQRGSARMTYYVAATVAGQWRDSGNMADSHWTADLAPGASGVVVEVQWKASTPLTESMTFMVHDGTNETGPKPMIGDGVTGKSPLRLVLTPDQLQGVTRLLLMCHPGGDPVGVAVDQPVEYVATTFFGAAPPEGYTAL